MGFAAEATAGPLAVAVSGCLLPACIATLVLLSAWMSQYPGLFSLHLRVSSHLRPPVRWGNIRVLYSGQPHLVRMS